LWALTSARGRVEASECRERDNHGYLWRSEGPGFTGCGTKVPSRHSVRSFGVRQLAAAFLPVISLGGISTESAIPGQQAAALQSFAPCAGGRGAVITRKALHAGASRDAEERPTVDNYPGAQSATPPESGGELLKRSRAGIGDGQCLRVSPQPVKLPSNGFLLSFQ